MKSFATALLSCGSLLLLAGCGQAPDPPAPTEPAPAQRRAAGLVLKLDNGKKWRVDEHTRRSAGQMTRLVDDTVPIETVADARALAAALEEGLQSLIQGCTMQGPAHDQLHVFLAALFPRVAELKNKADPAELRAAQLQVGSLFDAYALHFD